MANNLDFNNDKIMTIEMTPEMVIDIIKGQHGHFVIEHRIEPNLVCIGMAVLQIMSTAGKIVPDANGQGCIGHLKTMLDPDNPAGISVGYSPYLNLQKRIIL